MVLYQLFNNAEVRRFMAKRTIKKTHRIKPDRKTREMYQDKLKVSAIRIDFVDGTSIQIDTWIGNFLAHTSVHARPLSYLTALCIKNNLVLSPIELIADNIQRLGISVTKKGGKKDGKAHTQV